MSVQAKTLVGHLLTRDQTSVPAEELALVMERIGLAGKMIAHDLAYSSIGGVLGYSGDTNVQGERQKKLDDRSNEIFLEVFAHGHPACSIISEEMEQPRHFDRNRKGRTYAIMIDP